MRDLYSIGGICQLLSFPLWLCSKSWGGMVFFWSSEAQEWTLVSCIPNLLNADIRI